MPVIDVLMLRECGGRFAGPMEPEEFLDRFLSRPKYPDGKPRRRPDMSWNDVLEAKVKEMYEPYTEVCKILDEGRMMYENTHLWHPDPKTVSLASLDLDEPGEKGKGLKGDITVYDHLLSREQDTSSTMDFARTDRIDVLTPGTTYDAFDDSANDAVYFESDTEHGRHTRAQICAHTSAVFQLQFRFFCFSVLLMKTHARLIRWDRAGAVVTRAFDVTEKGGYLEEFIWRYSYLSRAERGFDDSVQLIENPDLEHARRLLERKENHRDPAHKHSDRPLYRLCLRLQNAPKRSRVQQGDSPPPVLYSTKASKRTRGTQENRKRFGRFLLLGPVIVSHRGPFGRATRSFIVCRYTQYPRTFFHLKDTHRMPVPEYLPEHEILNELQDKGVKGIPSVSCAWDVAPYGVCYDTIFADMFTQFNPGWWSTDEATIRRGRRALRVLRPYRLISPEVGVDLRTFKDWKQVLFVVDDTFRVLDAAHKAGWLHRDISLTNIMISAEERALVIDWECGQRVELLNRRDARMPDQTGTWQFMSVARQSNPRNAKHELADDFEATFWVLIWLVYRYGNHSLRDVTLRNALSNIFDTLQVVEGVAEGGSYKLLLFYGKNPLVVVTPEQLDEAIRKFLQIFESRYPPARPVRRAFESDSDFQAELEMYNMAFKIHKDKSERLMDATFLNTVLKQFLDIDWPDDCGPIKHEIPPFDEMITAISTQSTSTKRSSTHVLSPFQDSTGERASKRTRTTESTASDSEALHMVEVRGVEQSDASKWDSDNYSEDGYDFGDWDWEGEDIETREGSEDARSECGEDARSDGGEDARSDGGSSMPPTTPGSVSPSNPLDGEDE